MYKGSLPIHSVHSIIFKVNIHYSGAGFFKKIYLIPKNQPVIFISFTCRRKRYDILLTMHVNYTFISATTKSAP